MMTLTLQPSRCEQLGVALLHGLAAVAVLLSAVPPPLILMLWLALGYSGLRHWRVIAAPARIRTLVLGAEHSRVCGAGWSRRAAPPRGTFVSAWLVVLHFEFEAGGRPLRLLLWWDCLSRHDSWQLRRYLRGYPVPPG